MSVPYRFEAKCDVTDGQVPSNLPIRRKMDGLVSRVWCAGMGEEEEEEEEKGEEEDEGEGDEEMGEEGELD